MQRYLHPNVKKNLGFAENSRSHENEERVEELSKL